MSDAYGPSNGAMLRRAVLLTAACGAGALMAPRWITGGSAVIDTPPAPVAQPIPVPQHQAPAKPVAKQVEGMPVDEPQVTESYRAQRGNQFYVTGSVNGNAIHFLVDTGATWVSLTPEDAKTLGFNLTTLNWNIRTRTANGIIENAAVTLGDIRLGRIVEYNVSAVVMPQSGISLLGMTFLSRLRSWRISNGVLTIAS
jgi:aspartyl protease family protein